MRKLIFYITRLTAIGLAAFALSGCIPFMDNVPSGHVGVQVNRFGDDRGVNLEVKGPGRYWNGPNTDMFLFPTSTDNYTWDAAKKDDGKDTGDESFTFQVEGMTLNTDVAASFSITPACAAKVFQKYRKGINEIRSQVIRNMIRDSLNAEASKIARVEEAYSTKRNELQSAVEASVKKSAADVCINVEEVSFVNEMRLPAAVKQTINNKVAANQIADQKENELRAAKADAEKEIARAKGEAEATRIRGAALATNPLALQQMAVEKWDGKLPVYVGSGAPIPFVGAVTK